MRFTRPLAVVALSFAGLAMVAPTASAKDVPGGAQVFVEGNTVQVYANCKTSTTATAVSGEFASDVKLTPGANTLTGAGKLRPGAKSGSATVVCADGEVVTKNASFKVGSKDTVKSTTTTKKPTAATKAGFGGSQGDNTTQVAIGGAMVAGAAGLGGVALLRRRAGGNV
jgi:hypothetical protein